MADRRTLILSLLAAVFIAALAAGGTVMLAAPLMVRDWMGLQAEGEPAEVADDEQLATDENLLPRDSLQLTDADRQRHLRQWQKMSPQQRRLMQQRYASLQWLSPEARQLLIERYAKLESLPPDQRRNMQQQAETLADFESTLGRHDLAALDSLPPANRARALMKLWRQSQGLQ